MRPKLDYCDHRVAVIAERQHGVVGVAQLLACGVSRSGVRRRVERGRLMRLHRGVYAVGHRPSGPEGFWMAAVLVCGEKAVLSHACAAVHWGLLRPLGGAIDVSIPSQSGRRAPTGIRLHRRAALVAGDLTVHRSIPVTTVARTVADLHGVVPSRLVRRAARQAALFHGYDAAGLTSDTRSDLELDFLGFCRRRRLPAPRVNVKLAADLTVDFLWPNASLVVETDDHRYHRGSVSFEDDHLRDLRLRRLGYLVHRYTGAQLRRHPTEIATELGEILSDAFRPS